jgi:hypothetical protein
MHLFIKYILFLVVFLAAPTSILAADVFEVKGVYVDVTADNVTKARQQAMREAQGRAFDIMLRRLTLRGDREFLPWVEPKDRPLYIRDFSVSGEKTSSVRYLASFTFHFKADAIRNLLKGRNLAFAETISKPVLVLPLYEEAGKVSVWGEDNPWRNAWSGLGAQNGLIPLALPLGDIADMGQVNEQQAYDGDETSILAMANRYGVESAVVVSLAVAGRDDLGQPILADLIVNRVGSKYAGRTTLLGFQAEDGETAESFFNRAVQEAIYLIDEGWKQDNLLQFGVTDVVPVNLVITDLSEWLAVKARLKTVAVVRKIELALLSRDAVQMNIHFIGKLDQLINSLKQVDLDLTLNGESWSLVNLQKANPS